jgi:hypothetical protein
MKSVLQRSDGRFDNLIIHLNEITEVDYMEDIIYKITSMDDFYKMSEGQQLFIDRILTVCREATK